MGGGLGGRGHQNSYSVLSFGVSWHPQAMEALGIHGLRREYLSPFLCMVAELCALFCGVPRCLRMQNIFPLQYDYQNFVLISVFLISFY